MRPSSASVAAAVLCQRNRSLNAGGTQHAKNNNQNLFEDRTAKDKARHIAILLAAAKLEAARIARIHYLQV
jgi:hypothetical protein